MILAALNNYYHRLQEKDPGSIPAFGFSREKISYALVLSSEGKLRDIRDIRDTSEIRPAPRLLIVPQSSNRSGQVIKPFFMWDKAEYVLGVLPSNKNKLEDKKRKEEKAKTIAKNDAFIAFHQQQLADSEDAGIRALLAFLKQWQPERLAEIQSVDDELRDANLVFMLEGEHQFLHEKPEVNKIWKSLVETEATDVHKCLITGTNSKVARIHPAIKNIRGGDKPGYSIVTFNAKAFESYGKSQGANSPISEQAAFAYTTVLNQLLQKGSDQCLHLGDTSLVFWAEADEANKAELAEDAFSMLLNDRADDESETQNLARALEALSKGRPISDWNPEVEEDTRVYVLGLAPNASRLSIRYWEAGTLQIFAERLAQHYQDMMLEPKPWKTPPSAYRLLLQAAPHRDGSKPKMDDVSPHLGGELLRAILTGGRYPQSLLTNLIMRMRADGDISSLRVALCKAVITRHHRLNNTHNKEIPMSLDKTNTDPGYLLGRLFAAFESVQEMALGGKLNSTIRDKYYGSASATPGSVFPVVVRNGQNHLSRLRKDKPGLAVNIEKAIAEIMDKLNGTFPKSLRIEDQGHFAIGYYHQKNISYKTENDQGE